MDMTVETQIVQCAPAMNPALMSALVRRESNGNPFAIGMDGNAPPIAQPNNLADAVATAEGLIRRGRTFSVGLAQIHISNIKLLGMPWSKAFDGCTSLRNGQKIFEQFYSKAIEAGFKGDGAVFAALRGYNSGNIYSKTSNNYASAILASVTGRSPAPLHGASVAAMPIFSDSVDHGTGSESTELFSK